ncbi:hypothetical protein ACFL14_02450 [Patescibacteria group bacterium]
MEFIEYFIDIKAFQDGYTPGIVYSIMNSMLFLVPVWGIGYLSITVFKLFNAGGRPEKSMQIRNAVIQVVITLIIVYTGYMILRFVLDKIWLDI